MSTTKAPSSSQDFTVGEANFIGCLNGLFGRQKIAPAKNWRNALDFIEYGSQDIANEYRSLLKKQQVSRYTPICLGAIALVSGIACLIGKNTISRKVTLPTFVVSTLASLLTLIWSRKYPVTPSQTFIGKIEERHTAIEQHTKHQP